ncbi:MAG: OmpA family protein [Bacteroidetes bacterium]|nr:OmpA family protein [Bacteroidota bacterium]
MKKIILFSCFLSGIAIKAQDFIGFNQSNYAGVSGIYLNPASIVDSRMRFDMTLGAIDVGAYNNFVGLKSTALKGFGSFPAFNDPHFQQNYLTVNPTDHQERVFSKSRIAGPSFMININRKNAIAFAISERNYINVDGITKDLANLVYNGLNFPSLQNQNLQASNVNIQTMSWLEYGLTYAHVFKDDNEHFFKAGITVKMLQGIQSAYVHIKNFSYNFPTDSQATFMNSAVSYGHSSNLNLEKVGYGGNSGTGIFDFSQSYPGFSMDIGAVYEWRPNYKDYKYDMDGKTGLWRRDQNKYKLKISAALTDLGYITFKKGPTSNDFTANINYWDLKHLNPKGVGSMDSIFKANFPQGTQSSTYTALTPMAINISADYHLWKDFYVNLNPYIAFQFRNSATKVHDISSIILTPRWDWKWFGAFIPIQYNFIDGFRAGLALHLGPFAVGTSNIAPLIGQKTIYGADVYAIVKIPVPYGKPKDKDHDGVSNRKDKCPKEPGVWEFMGCPDKDGDHVPDSEDKCPTVFGVKELHGCPDRDGDGITDADDACPDDKGLAEFKGCPDRDGDKIIDKEDECPDEPGLAVFMGCPDRDNDSIPDKYDECPDVPGPKEYKGCPDKDGDKIVDKDDNCPDVPGPVENKGCPWPDTDKDGVLDKDDDCPTVPGIASLRGCPPAVVVKPAEQKILEKAFKSLQFATGSDVIKAVSYPSLNELAGLMKKHEGDWTLKLSGHTDNQGTPESNMILSEKRTKAVEKYLMKKGVKDDKITTEWFGQTQPIDSNDTPQGRQKNRRVEMKVLYK